MSRRTTEDRLKDLDKLREVLEKPRTLRYLEHRFSVSRATMHRWLSDLEIEGFELMRVGAGRPVKYVRKET